MTRMVDAGQASTNNTTTNTTNASTQNQPTTASGTANAIPFNLNAGGDGNFLQGMLGNLMGNPNSVLQMTSMILGDNDIDLNNLLQGVTNGAQTGSNQSPNLNLNALLGNLLNPNAGASSGARNIQQPIPTTSSTLNISDNRVEDNQYPVLNGPNESLTSLENHNKTWLGEHNSNIPNAAKLNYTKNVLTSVGETLRSYYNNVNKFLPLVLRLAECLERESLVQSSEERQKVQGLIGAVNTGFDHISKATGSLQPLLGGLEYGQNSGQGHLALVNTVGTQVVIENNSNAQNQSVNTINSNVTTGTARSNPMQDMLSQLTQPDNMRAMMSMVGNLMGNNTGNAQNTANQTGSSNGPNANLLNNLLSQLMGSMGGSMIVDNESSANVHEYFTNLLNDQNLRKTTMLKDIPQNILKITPSPNFSSFTADILSQFSVQEIILLKSLNLRGFTRLRRVIREKLSNYLKEKFENDLEKLAKNIFQTISQILIVTENETD